MTEESVSDTWEELWGDVTPLMDALTVSSHSCQAGPRSIFSAHPVEFLRGCSHVTVAISRHHSCTVLYLRYRISLAEDRRTEEAKRGQTKPDSPTTLPSLPLPLPLLCV